MRRRRNKANLNGINKLMRDRLTENSGDYDYIHGTGWSKLNPRTWWAQVEELYGRTTNYMFGWHADPNAVNTEKTLGGRN